MLIDTSYSQKGDTTIYSIYSVLILQAKFGLAVFEIQYLIDLLRGIQ